MKILLLGSNGQLGRGYVELSKTDAFPIGLILAALDRRELEYSQTETIETRVRLEKPDLILNCQLIRLWTGPRPSVIWPSW